MVLKRNKQGRAGSFIVAPDGAMFVPHLNDRGKGIVESRLFRKGR